MFDWIQDNHNNHRICVIIKNRKQFKTCLPWGGNKCNSNPFHSFMIISSTYIVFFLILIDTLRKTTKSNQVGLYRVEGATLNEYIKGCVGKGRLHRYSADILYSFMGIQPRVEFTDTKFPGPNTEPWSTEAKSNVQLPKQLNIHLSDK